MPQRDHHPDRIPSPASLAVGPSPVRLGLTEVLEVKEAGKLTGAVCCKVPRTRTALAARGFAERLEGFGRLHAGGLQQVEGGCPDLTDERAGLDVVAHLQR